MDQQDLHFGNLIEDFLQKQNSPVSASTIAKQKDISKATVNRILYKILEPAKKVYQTSKIPPLWKAVDTLESSESDSSQNSVDNYGCHQTIVLIDLGNVHDCLEPAIEFFHADFVNNVTAFADQTFNGYGVNPPIEQEPGVQVIQVHSQQSKAIHVELIWGLSKHCTLNERSSSPKKIHFIIATRSKGLGHLKGVLTSLGHRVSFITNAGELNTIFE